MEIIGIAQLDRLLSKLASLQLSQEATAEKIRAAVTVLKQSHTVSKWTFTAKKERLQAKFHECAEFTVNTQADPLNDFFSIVSQVCAHKEQELKPLIVKVDVSYALPQWETLDAMVETHHFQKHHYSSNRNHETNASIIEIIDYAVLEEAHREALLPDDRNLITPYIYRQDQRLSLGHYPTQEITNHYA